MSGFGVDFEEFSPLATVVTFDPPLPLLRGPFPASASDDPSLGPFVLAFPDDPSWRSAYRLTHSKVIQQCKMGARVGCSISASAKCKPPWWKTLLGIATMNSEERVRCEELEMSACFAAAEESCVQFAKEKCLPAFRDARIANQKGFPMLVFWGGDMDPPSVANESESHPGTMASNYRGNTLVVSGVKKGLLKT